MKEAVIIYLDANDAPEAKRADSEKQLRCRLDQLGIGHRRASVIRHRAGRAQPDPQAFRALNRVMTSGRSVVLAIADPALLASPEGAMLVSQILGAGGRLITLDLDVARREHRVDDTSPSLVGERGMAHRRGLEARVRRGGSASDHPFGYRLVMVAPADASTELPQPQKRIVIDEDQAQVVRQIFTRFVAGATLTQIARELNVARTARRNKQRWTPWRAQDIRRVLSSAKLAGIWSWGATHDVIDAAGRRRRVPSTEGPVVVERPELRIVDQDLWARAQERLRTYENRGNRRSEAQRATSPDSGAGTERPGLPNNPTEE